MKTGWNSLVVGVCNVIGLMLLALSATAGGSVRAAGDSPALQSIAIERLTKMASRLEQQVAALEASLATHAISLTATRIAARELCVADDSGAQTCISKAQLDSLLRGAMQTAQAVQPAQATPEPPLHPANEQGACPEKCVAPAAVATAAPAETPPAAEETAVPGPMGAAAAARETAAPEGAAGAVPTTAPPIPDQQQAAAESATPAPAEITIPTQHSNPAEAVAAGEANPEIATTARPEPLIPTDAPAKAGEPVPAGPAINGSTAAEPNLAQPER